MFKRNVKTNSNEMSEELILGHLIKYNLYLLAKAVVFSSVMAQVKDVEKAAEETQRAMTALDLDAKPKT